MIKLFEFYFDFASPYTFLAHKEIGVHPKWTKKAKLIFGYERTK